MTRADATTRKSERKKERRTTALVNKRTSRDLFRAGRCGLGALDFFEASTYPIADCEIADCVSVEITQLVAEGCAIS